MSIAVELERVPREGAAVEYRWDSDTDILTANCLAPVEGEGVSGSVELTGSDGSWLILDLAGGAVQGVEVAVWPDVRQVPTLRAPTPSDEGRVRIAARANGPIASIEVPTALAAESDPPQRTIHFRVGGNKPQRTVRMARDILIEVDASHAIAGVWLLNVPPFPGDR